MVTVNKFTAQLFKETPTRTVEVAPQPAVAKVVREGFQVPFAKVKDLEVERFLGGLDVVLPRQTPRVVSQSITPGVRVTAGTVVDLVLAPISDVPFGIFEGVHRDLRERNVATLLDGMLATTATRQTILKYDKPEDVPQAERTTLIQQFETAQVAIDETSAEANFASAFNAARVALAFK
jgi:hypothetical protein